MVQIIGQRQIQQQIDILLDAAKKKKDALPHMLFAGPSGFGKTTFALDVANKMGAAVRQINAAALKDQIGVLCEFHDVKKHSVVFIDEIHALKPKAQEAIYTVMEEFYININNVGGMPSERIDIKKFTLIGATTSTVSQPLLNRFIHVFKMEKYTDQEITDIISQAAQENKVRINSAELTKFARGNPRIAKNLLSWIIDFGIAKNISDLNTVIQPCMKFKNLYPGGFTKEDLLYLNYLKNARSVQGLTTIAHALNLDEKKIIEEIEPFLIQKGLIERRARGRILKFKKMSEWDKIQI